MLTVVDVVNNVKLAEIPLQNGGYGLAFNPATNRVYVSRFFDPGFVTVVNADAPFNVITTLNVCCGQTGVGVDPVLNRVYVANAATTTVTTIDTATLAGTTVSTGPATVTFRSGAQNLLITAQVTSSQGVVSEGTVTFRVVGSAGTIGIALTSPVLNGVAQANYALPAGVATGSYSVESSYSGSLNFCASGVNGVLTVLKAPTSTALTATPLTSPFVSPVELAAHVGSPAGTPIGVVQFYSNGALLGSVQLSGGRAILTSSALPSGSNSITASYQESENFLSSQSAAITVEVGPENRPPQAIGQNIETRGNSIISTVLAGTDPDGDSLTFGLATAPLNGSVSLIGATATYTPRLNFIGTDTFRFSASDGYNPPATGTVTIRVFDDTPPIISVQFSATPTSFGWFNTDVVVSWAAVDSESGVVAGCAPVTLTAETPGTVLTCTATNGAGLSSVQQVTIRIDKTPPVVSSASLEPSAVPLNTSSTLNAVATDPGTVSSGVVSAAFRIEAGPFSAMTASASGFTAALPGFPESGVITVCAQATDAAGNVSVSAECRFLAVYDPSAGFVTGGGWIDSPAGAYVADTALTGKANFGFVSKYLQGANVPDGQTEFQFRAGSLAFHSETYQWLVVAGARAQFKGTGEINGVSGYGFLLTATDGQQPGGGGVDKFRIKIWNIATNALVYDNAAGSDDLESSGQQAIGGGSIVLHK
jgi:DNA-binding beta-propeller fold protein YncE